MKFSSIKQNNKVSLAVNREPMYFNWERRHSTFCSHRSNKNFNNKLAGFEGLVHSWSFCYVSQQRRALVSRQHWALSLRTYLPDKWTVHGLFTFGAVSFLPVPLAFLVDLRVGRVVEPGANNKFRSFSTWDATLSPTQDWLSLASTLVRHNSRNLILSPIVQMPRRTSSLSVDALITCGSILSSLNLCISVPRFKRCKIS